MNIFSGRPFLVGNCLFATLLMVSCGTSGPPKMDARGTTADADAPIDARADALPAGDNQQAPDLVTLVDGGDDTAISDVGIATPDSVDGGTADGSPNNDLVGGSDTSRPKKIKQVFLIVIENHNWSTIKDSESAPYINKTLLRMGAHSERYKNPAGIHPSLPNYIWLESGDNLGITDDKDPSAHRLRTTAHLVTQLDKAGLTWKVYAEDISAGECPLKSAGLYGAKHVPQLYFDDVTDNHSPTSSNCIEHMRPYSELAGDLANNTVANYNFIVPNLCHDMHGTFSESCRFVVSDLVNIGDTWLSKAVPEIIGSTGFKTSGILFIVGDEGALSISDGPVTFIAVGTNVKPGFVSMVQYDHSSLLHSIETIFGLPYLRGAKTATDISDMFTSFP